MTDDVIVFDGIELGPKHRECLTVLLDHPENTEQRQSPVDAKYVLDEAHRLNHRSEVSRARSTLEAAGLIDVFEDERPDPLNNAKVMRPSPEAFEHEEFLRWEPELTLEERVDRLESMVSDLMNGGQKEIEPDPDEFEF